MQELPPGQSELNLQIEVQIPFFNLMHEVSAQSESSLQQEPSKRVGVHSYLPQPTELEQSRMEPSRPIAHRL